MATQRRSTRTTPLVQMIKEVYDTKIRMKEVLETQSDDFEEYGTLTHNKFVDYYNKGYVDGFNDGYHVIFPDVQLDEDDWKDGLRDKVSFTPTVPEYSTGSDIDNLIVMMQDSLRCRLLIKDELYPGWETDGKTLQDEDEFVTYPDLAQAKYQTMYDDGYQTGFEDGYNSAIDDQYKQPSIHQHREYVYITNEADFGDLYYWFDDDTFNRQLYTGPVLITQNCIIHAFMKYNDRVSKITSLQCYDFINEYFTIELLEDCENMLWEGRGPYGECLANIEWSIDDGAWESCYAGSSIKLYSLTKGTQVRFRNKSNITAQNNCFHILPRTYCASFEERYYCKYKTWGNVLSLFKKDFSNLEWSDIITYPDSSRIMQVAFKLVDSYVVDAENLYLGRNIITPKAICSSDGEGCFAGCSQLEIAPELHMTTVRALPDGYKSYIYAFIFAGCTNLNKPYNRILHILDSGASNLYHGLFANCTSLTSDNLPELPDNNLTEYCYESMFKGCISLTTAPELPATILNHHCYTSMFDGCTSLITAPSLPATAIAGGYEGGASAHCVNCYESMFKGCISLTTAPELPAPVVGASCYESMFKGCTSLVNAPALHATTLENSCYKSMFEGCTSLTTAPELPASSLWGSCYKRMFYGCTSLTTAPELPAENISTESYYEMFYGCTSLNYIKCLLTGAHGSYWTETNTYHWVYNVAATGTFIKNSNSSWDVGTNGIPSGWTVEDAA